MGVADVRFLVGEWRGGGSAPGPVATHVVGTLGADGSVRVVHETVREGRPARRETVTFAERAGILRAVAERDGTVVGEFHLEDGCPVEEAAPPALAFVDPGRRLLWTVLRAGDDAYSEAFGAFGRDRPFVPTVRLSHRRVAP